MVDFIIVGAGSAGCVMANRLSANSAATVLLLEAGGHDTNPDIRIPVRWKSLLNTDIDWLYRTTPQKHLKNRVITWNRGKVLGGTSAINSMIYIRGHRWDYDHWADLGNEGWSYNEVLPHFKKSENNQRGASDFHGAGGYLSVEDIPDVSPAAKMFIEAGLESGLPENDDFNGANQEGVGRYQVTHKNAERHSTAEAFLKPILQRSNLTIETFCHTTRILFDGTRAVGVEYIQNGETKRAYADSEIIICGGAINSPQLLLLSGIGAAAQLQQLAIPVVVDLPGVGANLQDHPQIGLYYTTLEPTRMDFSLERPEFEEYRQHKTGMFAVNRPEFGAFFRTHPDLDKPDIQILASPAWVQDNADIALFPTLLRAKSRGTLTLQSANPFDHPILEANYFGDEDDDDLRGLVESVKYTRQLMAAKVLESFVDSEINPGLQVQTDEQIADWIRETVDTVWHYSGTCKMGVDAMAVVNPQLQVYGVERLRVVDASIMPEVIGGNTNAPIIMIAEKAADMILHSK
jgi:choline dehydrogenase